VGGGGRSCRRVLRRRRGLVPQGAANVRRAGELRLLGDRGQQQLQRRGGRRRQQIDGLGRILHAAERHDGDVGDQSVPLRDVVVGIELRDIALQAGGDRR